MNWIARKHIWAIFVGISLLLVWQFGAFAMIGWWVLYSLVLILVMTGEHPRAGVSAYAIIALMMGMMILPAVPPGVAIFVGLGLMLLAWCVIIWLVCSA